MEQFVLGIFQEHLSKVIVGFRKEQVNANFLNGKGEIQNVQLNCAILNQELSKMTPYAQAESVSVSKLSIKVESWGHLRQAPIVHIHLDHVEAVLSEPLHYVDPSQRDEIRQVTPSQLAQLVKDGIVPPPRTTAYNLLDRILDNLTMDIRSVRVTFQCWGKFKTAAAAGPWTPPALRWELFGVRWTSVNEFGDEGSSPPVWRQSNNNRAGGGSKELMIYKKLDTEYRVSLVVKTSEGRPVVIPIVSSSRRGTDEVQLSKVEVQVAFRRRIRDGEFMAVQVDVTIPLVEVEVLHTTVPHLAHAASGLSYCFVKDRAFVDPLKSNATANSTNSTLSGGVSLAKTISKSGSLQDSVHNSQSLADLDDGLSTCSDDLLWSDDDASLKVAPSFRSESISERPLLVLSTGMTIREKVSFSLSIHHASVRGVYSNNDGRIQLDTRGVVVEAIWPKVTNEKGGHAQASVSFISIYEQQHARIRPLLIGGQKYDNTGSVETAGTPLRELSRDETFPLFEDRSVRPDPLGLRHSFPAQAVGFKMTVGFNESAGGDWEQDEMLILNEIGVDQLEVIADSEAWGHVIQFVANVDGGGFDPRWESGDWSDVLTVDMLLRPSEPLHLDDHLQSIPKIFLDQNELLSSDLFDATLHLSNFTLRIPAAIAKDIRSCDVVIDLAELNAVVSSGLPRCLHKEDNIRFPHDPSDIVHDSVEESLAAEGVRYSTFRSQLTYKGLSIQLLPAVPFNASPESRRFIVPTGMTMIVCFDGTVTTDNVVQLTLTVSSMAQAFDVNVDFDLLVSACSTLLFHTEKMTRTLRQVEEVDASYRKIPPVTNKIEDTLEGRKILVTRQIERSRQTGGVKLALWMKFSSIHVSFWRHNVPRSSPLRDTSPSTGEFIPALRVLKMTWKTIDFGIETSIHQERKLSLRFSASEFWLSLVPFRALLDDGEAWLGAFHDSSCREDTPNPKDYDMIPLFSVHQTQSEKPGLAVRLENHSNSTRSVSFSAEVHNGNANLALEDAEAAILLLLEALFVPVWEHHDITSTSVFPDHTVGAFFSGLLEPNLATKPSSTAIDTKSECCTALDVTLRTLIDTVGRLCDIILLKVVAVDLSVAIPSVVSEPTYKIQINPAEVLAMLSFNRTCGEISLLHSTASGQESWKSLLPPSTGDINLHICSRQSIIRTEYDSEEERGLLGPFEAKIISIDSNLSMSLSDIGTLDSLQVAEEVALVMKGCTDRLSKILENTSNLLQRNIQRGSHAVEDIQQDLLCNPIEIACLSAVSSVDSVKKWFRNTNERLTSLEETARLLLTKQAEKLGSLQRLVFLKEKERLAALSLCSSQQKGWLRVGVPRKTGQRGLMTCSLWPYWVVVHKSLVFLFESPSQSMPMDVISLSNASVHNLNGGQSRRDLQRAAALVDKAGCIHFLVAGTDSEYLKWIKTLQSFTQGGDSNVHSEAETLYDHGDKEKELTRTFSIESHELRRADSSASESTLSIGPSEKEVANGETSDFRKRLAGVSRATKMGLDLTKTATKSRLGSALQAARQKGKEVAEKRLLGIKEDTTNSKRALTEGGTAINKQDTVLEEAPFSEERSKSTFWSCTSCTFINSNSGSTCEMCGSARKVEKSSSEGEPSDDEDGATSRGRKGMRQRFGAAVRRARVRHNPKADQRQYDEQSGMPKPMHLRNVSISPERIGPLTHPFETNDEIEKESLKTLDGVWSITVCHSDKSSTITEEVKKTVDLESEAGTQENNGEANITEQTEGADAEEHNVESNGAPTRDVTNRSFPQFTITSNNHSPTKLATAETCRQLPEVLSLLTAISECVAGRLKATAYAEAHATNSYEIVRASGQVLKGLLGLQVSRATDECMDHIAQAISDFLNAIVECPLPLDALTLLTDFLTLSDASSRPCHSDRLVTDHESIDANALEAWSKERSELFDLATLCETELIRAEKQLYMAHGLASADAASGGPSLVEKPTEAKTPQPFTQPLLQEALHKTLIQIMEERDEAHARLIAADVLHIHELEQKRKQLEALESQLAVSRQHAADTNLFANDKERKQFEAMRRHDLDRQRDTDAELMSLCQQLAGEISSRTATNLEVIRLKEIRKIERETERAQKQALQDELLQVRRDLERERQRTAFLRRDTKTWKDSFEEAVRIKDNLSLPRTLRRKQRKSFG